MGRTSSSIEAAFHSGLKPEWQSVSPDRSGRCPVSPNDPAATGDVTGAMILGSLRSRLTTVVRQST